MRFVLCSMVLWLGLAGNAVSAKVVAVHPQGNDSAEGTEQKPLASLTAARDRVRRLRKGGERGAIEVLVQPGVYFLSEPLTLGPEDSGTAQGPTTYRAAAGGVILSGGTPIRGWKKGDRGLWTAPAPAGELRLLRVGERWAIRARFPNYDAKQPLTGGWLFADAITPAPAMGRPTTFMRYRGNDIPPLADPTQAEVHVFIAWGWVNAIVPLSRIDSAQHKLEFAAPGATQDVRAGNRYFIENAREALDAPGEWFLDKKRREVLYLPDVPGFPEVPVVAPRLDHLVRIAGDATAGRFVEHVHFSGFQFTDTTYTLTDQYYSPENACVRMTGARHCEIRKCEFAWCGGYALHLSDRSERCVFAENQAHHMGQGGVILTGNTQTQSHHCAIVANRLEHLGLIYKHVAGVYITSGCDHYVAHNRIVEVPRYAISMKSQGEENLSHRNVIEFNDIRRTNLETNDTGAIESLGYEKRDSGNIVRHNLILDPVGMISTAEGQIQTPYFTWGVYLDDFSSGTQVTGNIIVRATTGGVCIHAGKNNVIENNILVDGRDRQVHLHPEGNFMQGNRFVRNIVAYSRPQAELFYLFQSWKRNQPGRFAECDYNLYWLSGGDLKTLPTKNTPDGPFRNWLARGFDKHSRVANPRFRNPAQDDYRLAADSPAFALGFKPIPVELIGPQGWSRRDKPVQPPAAGKTAARSPRPTDRGI